MDELVMRSLTVLSKWIFLYLLHDPSNVHARFAHTAAEQVLFLGINKLWGNNESADSKLATLLEKFGSSQLGAAKECLQLAAKELSDEGKKIHRITAVTHATGAYKTQRDLGNYQGATEAAMVVATIYRDLLVTPVACREYAALAKASENTHYRTSADRAFAPLPDYEYNWEWIKEWAEDGASK